MVSSAFGSPAAILCGTIAHRVHYWLLSAITQWTKRRIQDAAVAEGLLSMKRVEVFCGGSLAGHETGAFCNSPEECTQWKPLDGEYLRGLDEGSHPDDSSTCNPQLCWVPVVTVHAPGESEGAG
jgi:hypothetical protein